MRSAGGFFAVADGADVAARFVLDDAAVGSVAARCIGFPLRFASRSAKYCRLLVSKSTSLRYSSSDEARLSLACSSLGISSRVELLKRFATVRYLTTMSVWTANLLYIDSARSASGFDNSKKCSSTLMTPSFITGNSARRSCTSKRNAHSVMSFSGSSVTS